MQIHFRSAICQIFEFSMFYMFIISIIYFFSSSHLFFKSQLRRYSIFLSLNFCFTLVRKGDSSENIKKFATYFKILYSDVCVASNNIKPSEYEHKEFRPQGLI